MDERLSSVHGRELLADPLEEGLDRGRVADKGRRHFDTTWGNVTLSGRDVSWDPLDKVTRVFGLHTLELILDLFHGDLSSVDTRDSEVSTVSWVRSSHHVLGVEHLLSELRHSDGAVARRATRSERGETDHEEMETWEWHHVDGEFSQVRVELTWETETGGDTRHDEGDEVVEVTISWGVEFESAEANVVQRLVVDAEGLVRVFDKLVDGKSGVVWLDDRVRDLSQSAGAQKISSASSHLWRWDDGEGTHHSVRVFFSDL